MILKQLPTPKFVFRHKFYKSPLLCVLKTKTVHLPIHLWARGVHSLPLNNLLGHISCALSVATGRIPSSFCDIADICNGLPRLYANRSPWYMIQKLTARRAFLPDNGGTGKLCLHTPTSTTITLLLAWLFLSKSMWQLAILMLQSTYHAQGFLCLMQHLIAYKARHF